VLFRALSDMPEYKSLSETPLSLTGEKSTLYFHLLEILSCVIQQHGFRSTHFILDSGLAPRLASLLSSGEKHLRLVALRIFRSCLKLNNRNINNHLIKHGIFAPIIDLTVRESKRDNLMSSACQDFFEYIRKENPKELINHIMKERMDSIRKLAEGDIVGIRFQNLIRRWEQNNEPPPAATETRQEPINSNHLDRTRGLDSEEDDWFNGSDEEDLSSPKVAWMQQQQRLSQGPTLKRKRAPAIVEYPIRRRQFPPSPTPTNSPPSTGLVDYEDEEPTPSDVDLEGTKTSSISKAAQRSSQNSESDATSREKAPKPIKIPVLGGVADVRPVQRMGKDAVTLSNTVLPPTSREKRQRDEDEDDELLARLTAKSKRPSIPETHEGPPLRQPGIRIALGKVSDGAKKIKLNLGLSRKPEPETTRTVGQDDERG